MPIIDKVFNCVQVQFTYEELVEIFTIAQERNGNKTEKNVPSYVKGNELTQYEKHIIGAYGEMAFALHMKLEVDRTIFHKGDNGVDFTYKDKTIDIKTTTKNEEQQLTFKRIDKFKADIAILAQIVSPNCVRLLSCTTKENFKRNAVQMYNNDSLSLGTNQMARYVDWFWKD